MRGRAPPAKHTLVGLARISEEHMRPMRPSSRPPRRLTDAAAHDAPTILQARRNATQPRAPLHEGSATRRPSRQPMRKPDDAAQEREDEEVRRCERPGGPHDGVVVRLGLVPGQLRSSIAVATLGALPVLHGDDDLGAGAEFHRAPRRPLPWAIFVFPVIEKLTDLLVRCLHLKHERLGVDAS